ncbi:type II toxin-antitoxin system RelE family toxin [Nocardiopsis lambiniae]|uniref:Uncharacterized protein n=1 Tax=Nocardiopsis lambiniae TaxID=3075539 RepID=A0ABU2MH63_9ACTN|nr:hypothetical protein [Nocardiopsis sp. DSM 44743]MDT0331899.1 hypothetical protein [Nocardiopsis sp. DSM 44743]
MSLVLTAVVSSAGTRGCGASAWVTIGYAIDDGRLVVVALRIAHRREVHREL